MNRTFTLSWLVLCTAAAVAQDRALKVVVIAGEDAVNIVRQNTAVAPIVEVRDRNDLPIAGALVRFTIDGGRNAQFAGGVRTVTLTTNAAGRAAVAGLTPTGSGTVQISVAATFQGQTAVATITQTNVATAVQASAASGTASGSGGGFPTGVVTAVGAAGAGGIIAVRKLTAEANAAPYLCGASASAGVGLVAATVYTISAAGCDENNDPVTHRWDFGDGTIATIDRAAVIMDRSLVTHTYQSRGTFNVTITFSDGSQETTEPIMTVTIVSMDGQWALSGSNNIFLLTQSGASIGGSLSSPSGSGAATGSVQASGIFGSVSAGGVVQASVSGTMVTLTVPSVTGTGVTPGTFVGQQSGNLNSFTGTFTSAAGTRAAVITRQ
jgi:hypothetical protein